MTIGPEGRPTRAFEGEGQPEIVPKPARASSAGPNPHKLGGAVIDQLPIPQQRTSPGARFVGSPSIAVTEDGTYLASHDTFVAGGDPIYAIGTSVFRSADKGRSWASVSAANDLAFATLFTSGRNVYLLGRDERARIVIRKSADTGDSWGRAHAIGTAPRGMTPNSPVVHEGRIWFARGGKGAMSAPLDRSVLDAGAWTSTNQVADARTWFPGALKNAYWTEAQVVASPQTGVVVLPKTFGRPYTALIRATDRATATFDRRTGLVCFPGGEKKFACVYDPVSQTFFALSNPVLPAHVADAGSKPELVRNTGAIFTSPDLSDWSVGGVFLYSSDVDHEAFQYLAFAIDGDDLAVVARTALAVDGRSPPRGHESNLLTFHVVKDFRNLEREQVLVADTNNDRVVRFEANLTSRLAPLGTFSRRTRMTKPLGIAQGPDGNVYVSEQVGGGRVLRFRPDGRLRSVLATEGVDFTGRPESLIVGADGHLFMTVAFGPGSDKVYKIDTGTGRVSRLVASSFSSAAGEGTLDDPRGIAIGPRGHLFVADRGNDRIREFDPVTGEFLGNLTEDQRRPQALTWDPTRRRLLFSRRTTDSDHDIARVSESGRVLTLYTRQDVGLALGVESLGGRVYWTDYDNNRIYMLTSEAGKKKTTSVSTGLNRPGNMARVTAHPSGQLSRPCVRIHTGQPV